MAVPLSTSRLRTPKAPNPVAPTGAIRASAAATRAVQPRLAVGSRRKLAKPRVALKSPGGVRPPEDKGLIGGTLSSIGNIISFPGTVIKSLPTIIGKGAQSLVGAGETLFDIGADIINPNLYTSRSEVDLAKGRELGLKGADLLAYSMQRTVPLLAPVVESIPKTAARFAETASGGLGTRLLTGRNYIDLNEPGFDYGRALRQGQLGTMLIEDIGNVMIGGRVLGMGNLGVQAGGAISRAGSPRLGQTVSTVGRFTEEPIATTVRGATGGAARLGREYAQRATKPISPRMSRFLDTMEMMSTSQSPLMTGASRAAESVRLGVDVKLAEYDTTIANLRQERRQADLAGDIEKRSRIDEQIVKAEAKRKSRAKMGETTFQARREQENATRREAARQGYLRSAAIRFDELGAAPEPVETMRARAVELRSLADQREAQAAGMAGAEADQLRASAQSARNQADFNDRMADVKQSNPQKLQDVENRAVNFEAANIINSKLIDQVIADLDAGLTLDEIMARIQPKELIGRTIEAGYGYTREGVQRAIDFVRGAVDEVDRLEMDVASQILNMFAAEMSDYATQPGTLVGGVLSPAQFGDTAVPEIFVVELGKRSFQNRVLAELDAVVPEVVIVSYPELLDQYPDLVNKPNGSFTEFAKSRPDSPEYEVAREVLRLAEDAMGDPQTSIFRNDPRLALEVSQFFKNPAIFPARMRPMLAYRQSALQDARAADVQDTLFNLRQLADEFPDVLPERRKVSLQDLLDTFAKSDTAVFDRDFYMKTRDLLSGVIGDITRRRQATGARLGEVGRLTAESDARLAQIEAQARAAAGMVEQALLRPEELTPTVTEETQALRQQAEELRAEAGRLSSQTAPVAGVASRIETDTKARDAVQQTLETEQQALRDLETKLATEERILNSVARDAQEPDVLLAEVVAAEELARQGVGAEPLPSEQKAWKAEQVRARQADVNLAETAVNAMFPGDDPRKLSREDFWVEDIWVNLKKAIPNPRHFREFFARMTETKYENVKGRIPARAEFAPVDPNVGKLEGMGKVRLDEAATDNPRGPLATEEWTLQLAEAWSRYMQAVDALNEMKRKPLKSDKSETVKDAMMQERSGDLQQQAWENPRTGETVYGVRPLNELRRIEQMVADTEAFARQYEEVQRLRRDAEFKAREVQDVTRRLREIDVRIQRITEETTQGQLRGPQAESQRLLNDARRLTDQADRLEAENVRLRPTVAKERITLTRQSGKRLRAANARRAEGREVTGYEFTKGVAKKLDDAQTAELREQQRLYEQTRQLQARLNDEDNALIASRETETGAQQYPQALSAPSGATLLRGVDRPRLLGETDQPTWMPVGEASGVFETVRAPKTITTEGMAQEQRLSIENQRQSTFMPLTPGQFAARMNDILNQTSRNRVVNSILTNEQYVTDVQTLLTPARYEELRARAEASVRATGIDLDSAQFKKNVDLELGNVLITELAGRGFEPVSPVVMPDPTDPYAERSAVGDLLGKVDQLDMKPNTLVMKKGLRENIAAQYQLASTENLPAIPAQIMKFAMEKTASWKSVVLPFSTRWQVGDAMGNIINAAVRAGLSPQDTVRMMVDVYRRVNPDQPLTIPKMAQPIFSRAITDPAISVLVGAGLQTSNIKLSELNRMHPKGSLKPSVGAGRFGRRFFPKFREASFNLNETQNAMARSAVAEAKLLSLLDEQQLNINEIDPLTLHNNAALYEAVVEAVRSANDALGDFSKMSFGEKQYIRTIYPFWSWIRFINTAAGQLILTQPDRVLFYAHLGSMAVGDDAEEFTGWLRDQVPVPTPWGTFMMDLSFLNPYSDALLLSRDPFTSSVETATGISPVLSLPLSALAEGYYSATGSPPPLLRVGSRPGYLEGRPGETTRTLGDTLGGLGYQTFRAFAGPFRLATELAPTVRVPLTDVLLGPGPRYPQGSPRTTGIYARPRLSPTQQRISAVLRTFGIPAPTADIEQARLQSADQRRAGARALRRRENERRLSRIRQ